MTHIPSRSRVDRVEGDSVDDDAVHLDATMQLMTNND